MPGLHKRRSNDGWHFPVPDGMFLVRSKQGLICTFLEIDTGSMALKRVVEKLQRYWTWSQSARSRDFIMDIYRKHGATNPQPRFRIAIVCGDANQTQGDRRLNSLMRAADKFTRLRGNIAAWLTTTLAVRNVENVLAGSIWRRQMQNGMTSRTLSRFLHS